MYRLLLLVLFVGSGILSGQSAFQFQSFATKTASEISGDYLETTLDLSTFRRQLTAKNHTIELPLPDGGFATFSVQNDPVFEPSLAAKYPLIGSYRVFGDWGEGRIAISHKGVDALLRGPKGSFAIQPAEESERHLVFYSSEYTGEEFALPLGCGYDPADPLNISEASAADAGAKIIQKSKGGEARELRQYDLVLTNTGEFAKLVGGKKEDVLAAFNTAVSVINVIFQREVGVRMNLLELSEQLIYLDADSDPFVDSDEGSGLLSQVIEAFRIAKIPNEAYDLGHIFTSRCVDVGGVVSGAACNDGSKTRGVTCLQGGNIARTAEGVMAHEIAHQFSVSHTWNNCPGNEGQRAGRTAFEPGSGTTIMSYSGACGSQNIGADDVYYHNASLEQFLFFTREGGADDCATIIETANFAPDVELPYQDGFFIPKSTPFVLKGSATDDNDPQDQLTFNWEQFDLGDAVDIDDPKGSAPTFRSVPPDNDGNVRYFPRIDRVANNIQSNTEVLPDYARSMTFRLTARDNNEEAGGVDWATLKFNVAEAGPFLVNNPIVEVNEVWEAGEYREVTWDVAGTDKAPIFARSVNILLSEDGGLTFDRVLASNVANNGSAFITVPDLVGDAMRVVIEAADNVFYNMNDTDFEIAGASKPGYTLESDVRYDNICLPETVVATFTAGSVRDFSGTITLAIDSTVTLPAGLKTTFSSSTLKPGETTKLTFNLDGVTKSGRFTVPLIVTAPGTDSSRREIVFDVVANDFDDLMLAGPTEGTSGIVLVTDFDWTSAENATEYEIQIATSASFSDASIFEEAAGLSVTEYTPEEFLAANTLYFWRVRPFNACGAGPWTETASFRTVSSQCDTYAGTDTPVSLPGSGGKFSRQSKLFIERRGSINDLNLPNITVNYQFASKVTISLTSPKGTVVELYKEKCFSTNTINLGFDDDAPSEVACPPDDKRVFKPSGKLSSFNGEDTFGEWILTVSVSETNGSAGQIAGWNIEFCADVTAALPQTVVNEPTKVKPLGRNSVLRSELEIISSEEEAAVTYFVITRLPARGKLELAGEQLMMGDTFSQADINAQRLVYESMDTTEMTDDFGFVVTTPAGGYISVTYHDIEITDQAINAVRRESVVEASLSVFPNPVSSEVNIRWDAPGQREIGIEVYDMTGRRVHAQRTALAAGAATVPVERLAAGVYLLRVDGAVRRIVKR